MSTALPGVPAAIALKSLGEVGRPENPDLLVGREALDAWGLAGGTSDGRRNGPLLVLRVLLALAELARGRWRQRTCVALAVNVDSMQIELPLLSECPWASRARVSRGRDGRRRYGCGRCWFLGLKELAAVLALDGWGEDLLSAVGTGFGGFVVRHSSMVPVALGRCEP